MKKILALCLVAIMTFPVVAQTKETTPEFDGYLFAYFEGKGRYSEQEQLRFAVSADAVNWKALNNNRPIISSEEISQTGGIRDPYLVRERFPS